MRRNPSRDGVQIPRTPTGAAWLTWQRMVESAALLPVRDMFQSVYHTRFVQALIRAWRGALRRMLHWWVRTTEVPDDPAELGLDPERPVFYIFEAHALTSLLVLEELARKNGWPLPTSVFETPELCLPRNYGALKRYRGVFFRRLQKRRHSETLKKLVNAAHDQNLGDVQILPVSVLIGRAPDSEESIFKILFSENWDVGGRLKRFLSTVFNGRATFVHYGQPITLARLLEDGQDASRDLRRLSRVLRVHFKRVRTAAIGPDRSHRRTLVERILRAEAVKLAIEAKARRDDISQEKARAIARKYAWEIAADYSYSFVRIADLLLTWFWNRIYRGIRVRHFSSFREQAPEHEVIYVPCHRSHIDYMLLSYILYHRGFVPPHIAAGVNLNMPLIGPLLRRGGAFFLRRTFRSQPLYAAVFSEYVGQNISRGIALEYFIEGTRSRTGRLLPPKAGMLTMTIRSYVRNPRRPIMFQPVYIGYERLAEGNAYISELSGHAKKPESLSDLRNVVNILRKNYGEVHVSFGKPVMLNRLLNRHHPSWAQDAAENGDKPAWLPPIVEDLAQQLMVNINAAAHVNPVNLLACALLATRKQAMDEKDLMTLLDLYKKLLGSGYADRVTVTECSPAEIIDYGLEIGVIERRHHRLGDIIQTDRDNAVLLTYFRNNISHLLALPSWLACCFINSQRVRKVRIRRLSEAIYPFLKRELFLPWDPEALPDVLQEQTEALIETGLLRNAGDSLQRAPGGSNQAWYLRLLGNAQLQTFERYYITIAVLAKNGSGKLSRNQLEQLCMLTAQRISILHEFDAPEFSDKTLFRQFIDALQSLDVLGRTESGNLTFDQRLERFATDAKLILGKELRHGIIQVTPKLLADAEDGDQAV